MNPAIQLNALTKYFQFAQQERTLALDSLSLTIPKGEFLILLGENGSGKSTLMNLIAGNLKPDSGSVSLHGQVVTGLNDYERSRWIARVFQNPYSGTASDLTVLENFRLAALRSKRKGLKIGLNTHFREQVYLKVASLEMGLEHKLDQAMGTLSGGQRQALTLLMSVMDHLDILLLDEPTAALDPRSAALVMRVAEQLTRSFSLTTLLITHHLKDAYQYGDRVIQLSEGRIVRDLGKEEKTRLSLNDYFGWFTQ